MPAELSGLADLGDWLCDPANKNEFETYLSRYFRETPDSRTGFSGRYFEWFIERSRPTAFTPWDFLAVASLSVSVPSHVQAWLLSAAEPARLLSECVALIEAAGSAGRPESFTAMSTQLDGRLSALYHCFRKQHGMGYVTSSKLLAAKFPDLVPIRDDKVERALGLKGRNAWWEPLRHALSPTSTGVDPMAVLASLSMPECSPRVSALRKLDVILWMKQNDVDRGQVDTR